MAQHNKSKKEPKIIRFENTEKFVDNINNETEPLKITAVPITELINPNTPAPVKIFGKLIYKGGLTICFGDSGTGKSLLMYQLADAISKGDEYVLFDENRSPLTELNNEIEAQKIGYLDFELSEDQRNNRYGKYQFHPNFLICNYKDSLPENFYDDLEQFIKAENLKIVIIDNLSCITFEDVTQGNKAAKMIQSLNQIKTKLGITIIAVSHIPKLPKGIAIEKTHLNGSKMVSNLIDNLFALGETKEKGLVYLKQLKNRSGLIEFGYDNIVLLHRKYIRNNAFLGFEFESYGNEYDYLIEREPTEKSGVKASVIVWKDIFENKTELLQTELADKLVESGLYKSKESANKRIRKALDNKELFRNLMQPNNILLELLSNQSNQSNQSN